MRQIDGGDTNLFGYVLGNPANFTDVTGFAVGGIANTRDMGIEKGGGGAPAIPLAFPIAIPMMACPEKPPRDCEAERQAGWNLCNELYREIHDGSQGRCYKRVQAEYDECKAGK